MTDQANQPNAVYHQKREAPRKRSCLWWGVAIALGGIIILGVVGALLAALVMFLPPRSPARPVVVFNRPHSGERVEVGRELFVDAFARDQTRLQRIEFWIDGRLHLVKESQDEEGETMIPLLTAWQPMSSGTHALTLRAVNTQGRRTVAMVQVEAYEANDADNDGIQDSEDECPSEPSALAEGCPSPNAGDTDGDGLEDSADACPNEAGSLQARGCPDPDGDGLIGDEDACPEQAGSAEENGCLPNIEEGSEEAADDSGGREVAGEDGAPIPQDEPLVEEEDMEREGAVGGDLGLDEILEPSPEGTPVEIDVISFYAHRGGRPFDGVYCYYQLMDSGLERVPVGDDFFSMEGGARYNLEDYLGGANSRSVTVSEGQALTAHVECSAYNFYRSDEGEEAAYFDLGEVNISHAQDEWNGVRRYAISTNRPDPSSMFLIEYRVCSPTCSGIPFPAPVLSIVNRADGRHLTWRWDGDRNQLDGFFIYMNGTRRIVGPDTTDILLEPYRGGGGITLPPCGDSYLYHVSAFFDFNPFTGIARQESPRSNGVSFMASPENVAECPYRVRIVFERLIVPDISVNDQGQHDSVGPVAGFISVWASNGSSSRLSFRGGNCPGIHPAFCYGVRIRPNSSISIMSLFQEIAERKSEACEHGSSMCGNYEVPSPLVNYVDIEMGGDDELSIGAQIIDIDSRTSGADVLFGAFKDHIRGSDFRAVGEQTLIDTANNIELRYTFWLRSE